MPYCPRCGVETDPSVRSCPLCATVVPAFDDLGPGEPAWPSPDRPDDLDPAKSYASSAELRGRALLAVTATFATAALAVTAADLLTSGTLTWARWPLVSLADALAMIAAVFAWYRRPDLWGSTWALLTVVFLAALDLCDDGALGWFPSLGLPITAVTYGLLCAGVLIVRHSRRLGFNLFGLVPGLAALELGAVDLSVTAWTSGRFGLGWSTVTFLVLVPLALLFYFLHYAFKRTPDLKRIFHF